MRFGLRTLLVVVAVICCLLTWFHRNRITASVVELGLPKYRSQDLEIKSYFPITIEADGMPVLIHSCHFGDSYHYMIDLTGFEGRVPSKVYDTRGEWVKKYPYQPTTQIRVSDWIGSVSFVLSKSGDDKYSVKRVRKLSGQLNDGPSSPNGFMGTDAVWIEN